MERIGRNLRKRPWLAAPVLAGVVMIALLFVPVSYEVTSGYVVRVGLNGVENRDDAGRLAVRLGGLLGTEHVAVSRSISGGGNELIAQVPSSDRSEVAQAASRFATELSQNGVSSRLEIQPVHSLVSRNLYAMDFGRVLRLDLGRKGSSRADVEKNLRGQLEASGVHGAQVAYSEHGTCSLIQIIAPGGAQAAASGPSDGGVDIALICSGPEAHCPVPCSKTLCEAASDVQLTVDGQAAGYVCKAEAQLASTAGMSDQQIADALTSQFKAKGVEASVVVQGGRVVSVDPVCARK